MIRKPFATIYGPDFLASYLVNGDDSSLTLEDKQLAEEWIRLNGIRSVVSCDDDEGHFARLPHPWNCFGQILGYVCEVEG